jgi:hypothetical protein
VDPSRVIFRNGNEDGERRAIVVATPACSEAEWSLVVEAIKTLTKLSE